jgi:hypothetical protein
VFGNIFEEKKRLEVEMVAIQVESSTRETNEDTRYREENLRLELEKRDKQEEILCQQKSRV